jgi:hypothetical protein
MSHESNVPAGWKLVPVEPTIDMKIAMHKANSTLPNALGWEPRVYAAALAAAPQAPAPEAPKGEPVAWEYREWHNEFTAKPGWSEWKRVEPRNVHMGTVADSVQEFEAYITQGFKYELRPLYTTPQTAPKGEPVAEVRTMMTGGNAGIATHIVALSDDLQAGDKLYNTPQPALKGEPVARVLFTNRKKPDVEWLTDEVRNGTLLYTTPQPKRVPLTRKRVAQMVRSLYPSDRDALKNMNHDCLVAELIERAHDITGEAE